ncbi:hypothetical protein I4U23_012520 [Adineta vaga]|nr:hypothetical protein I4U23_012520 [Adineta vaga]
MQVQAETGRLISCSDLIHIDRPDSLKHVDLHVYIIPKEVWKKQQNLADNDSMTHAVSVGFVHVSENLTIHELRRDIRDLCRNVHDFPKEFLYLRSVGRCLTKVKEQQEKELKVKNYRPPMAYAPEIFILENSLDKDAEERSSLPYPLLQQNSTSNPNHTAKFTSRRQLSKLQEEQERLYSQQQYLARKRQEMEEEQNREEAAFKIQTAFRNYRHRQKVEFEMDHSERETSKSKSQKDDDERDVIRISHRLEKLKMKRMELETNRDLVVRRLQQLQAQTHLLRRQEKDFWRQKYLIEKSQITAIYEQNHLNSKNSIDLHTQVEQTTMRLNNTTKLRQQAEYESRLLRQELQQISSTLNTIERHRLPKQSSDYRQTREPISFDITVQY